MSSHTSPAACAVEVHKFGGSSLADAPRMHHAAGLVRNAGPGTVVVASAMGGVTQALHALLATGGGAGDDPARVSRLTGRHLQVARSLAPDDHALGRWLEDWGRQLADALRAHRDGDPDAGERVLGAGELASSRLLHAALGGDAAGWAWLDAREVLFMQPGETGLVPQRERSREALAAWRSGTGARGVVTTGYIASLPDGRATTLGRNGSDYSAALFADLLDAGQLTIWTDVDGIHSADPRRVPEAVPLPTVSYAEACELAYFGAGILHPQTLAPLQARGIPVLLRNSLRPEAPGTRISGAHAGQAHAATGLSLVEDRALLELVGSGLVGVPGTAERFFGALRGAGISVTMISQGSSEHSICCVIDRAQLGPARQAVEAAFADWIAEGRVQGVRHSDGISVLAAVGEGMVGRRGVAARLFTGLAQGRVNVRAIAQGAGERNISVAVDGHDAARALRAAHAAFWLSPRTLSIGIVGPGQVGRALLEQIGASARRLRQEGIDLRVRALADSRRMVLSADGASPDTLLQSLQSSSRTCDLDALAAHVAGDLLPHAVIVDCTASASVSDRYADWLEAGIHVVTPNKLAASGPLAGYRAIQAACRTGGGSIHLEATVGAGLPVLRTLRDLVETGDRLHAVEGLLSGTLSWLFNRFDGRQPFSGLVREARRLGYTEPDPRVDLSGLDVARKLVILARQAGHALSLSDVEVEGLVPPGLAASPSSTLEDALGGLDAAMASRLRQAQASGGRLRYLARFSPGVEARVGPVVLPQSHPACHTRLTDNLVLFTTDRYRDNPLVVQGPGAGPEVTAAGIFGDLLAVVRAVGGAGAPDARRHADNAQVPA